MGPEHVANPHELTLRFRLWSFLRLCDVNGKKLCMIVEPRFTTYIPTKRWANSVDGTEATLLVFVSKPS